ncbi:MAG: sodium:proton antiporter [Oscillospiraceae bacterium]|nr:sodium:proton antiporter [Oscillospiraceae bacterium]
MKLVQNVPFFCIMLSMFSGTISSVLPGKWARRLNVVMISLVTGMTLWLLQYLVGSGIGSYTYMMGHFPAPWGNELRVGLLEVVVALFFSVIMLLSLLGGRKKLDGEVEATKHNIYYILCNLLLSSLLALVYTNDLFTAYVFVEINTIAACGLIMIRQNGRCIEAAVRYMIMSLLGSGLLLLSICMIYDLTGHLLMENIQQQIRVIMEAGTYRIPMLIIIGILTVGLAIKSALFPFHSWVPDAYGYSTVSSGAILSSLVSKGYIFLLFKVFYRVIGFQHIADSHILNLLFLFGLCGMIFGSASAIWEKDIRRMIAFSSVAQIGYIYMGLGLGTEAGVIAAIFHVLVHGATKSLLFVSAIGLTDVSGGSRSFFEITGSAYRNKAAGVGFLVASLSMVGIPVFSGFVSKLLFAEAAVLVPNWKLFPTLIVLAISTVLNAIYFLKTIVRIYTPVKQEEIRAKGYFELKFPEQKLYCVTIFLFVLVNLILGMASQPIIALITEGLHHFA